MMQAAGAYEYLHMSARLLPFHRETRMLAEFEREQDVCSVYEMDLETPAGERITLTIGEPSGDTGAHEKGSYRRNLVGAIDPLPRYGSLDRAHAHGEHRSRWLRGTGVLLQGKRPRPTPARSPWLARITPRATPGGFPARNCGRVADAARARPGQSLLVAGLPDQGARIRLG
jgi:hypothetical protein